MAEHSPQRKKKATTTTTTKIKSRFTWSEPCLTFIELTPIADFHRWGQISNQYLVYMFMGRFIEKHPKRWVGTWTFVFFSLSGSSCSVERSRLNRWGEKKKKRRRKRKKERKKSVGLIRFNFLQCLFLCVFGGRLCSRILVDLTV